MRLGQHFLVNDDAIKKFVSLIDFSYRPIIEIGGGKGNISKLVNPDLIIELDEKFSKYLFNLVIADARFLPIYRGQIVSSLPFYITYDFFEEVVTLNNVKKMVLILQSDFVEKVKNEPTYISFLINYYYNFQIKYYLPPWFFEPKPKVYSAIVIFERLRDYDDNVIKILKCISRYKNKTLNNALELCGINSKKKIEKKVRDFKPWEVTELLNLITTEFA